MTCPAGYVCIAELEMLYIVRGLIFVLIVAAIAFLATLTEDDPKPPEDTNRPKAKKAKGK